MSGRHSPPHPAPAAPAAAAPAARETGWLPDCVFTGDKFETGLAFFADDLGRITRFSREPADLSAARRLAGQAALPGMVNVHSQTWQRVRRGRPGPPPHAEGAAPTPLASRLAGADLYDTARMAFMEMMLAGITCVGEFHALRHQPDGTPGPDPQQAAHELLRAARDTGLRLALFPAAAARPAPGQPPDPVLSRCLTPSPDQFLHEVDGLRELAARDFPGDGAWVGIAAFSLPSVPLAYLKAVATHARAHRLRLQVSLAGRPAEHEAWVAEHRHTPAAALAELGLLDKRFTAVHAQHLTDEDARLLGAARAIVGVCPTSERWDGGAVPADKILAAGGGLALGTGIQEQTSLLAEARLLAPHLRAGPARRDEIAVAATLWQAATAAGARSLGAPSGALEVGRPADFFTVSLFDPALAGADPAALLGNIVFALERRAIREVWVGARQVVVNGRHPLQGAIVSRFIELQQRLWGGGAA